jgi:hypothetical protein
VGYIYIQKIYFMATARLLVVGIVVQGNAFRLDPGHDWLPWSQVEGFP